MKELITLDPIKRMPSQQLAVSFGQDHKEVLKRLRKIAESQFDVGEHYSLTYYLDAQGKKRPALDVCFSIAFAFALSSRKANARQLVFSMFETKILELKSQVEAAYKIQKLEQQLKDRPEKLIGMSSKANRKSLHDLREELHEQGFCDKYTKVVKHYFYPVNDEGILQGYRNKPGSTGESRTIDLNFRLIDDEIIEEV